MILRKFRLWFNSTNGWPGEDTSSTDIGEWICLAIMGGSFLATVVLVLLAYL